MFDTQFSKSHLQSSSRSHREEKNKGISLPAVPVLQNKPVQKIEIKDKEPLQGKFPIEPHPEVLQKKQNHTGLPDHLKNGVEQLSGLAMDDVKVHYNSDKPAQLQALAYAQGTDIHIGTGHEKHLPHEAWHVVQQKQGRVQPTLQMKEGVAVNNDLGLENEADVMGQKIAGNTSNVTFNTNHLSPTGQGSQNTSAVQLKKTVKPDNDTEHKALIKALCNDVRQDVLTGKITDKDKSDAIWNEAVAVFDVNRNKGEGFMAKINAAITNYKNATVPESGKGKSPKQTLIDNNIVKRTEYDRRFRENYANAPIEKLGLADKYRLNTKGYDPLSVPLSKPIVPQGEHKGNYSNEVDFTDNSITAKWNMGANMKTSDWTVNYYTDKALEAKKGLPNSEILWQQYKMAAEEKYKGSGTKDSDVTAALKLMSRIKRASVINSETLVTVYMAYDEGKNWDDDAKDFVPETEEFNAVLGTPNGKSSVLMLTDHLDEIEKTIEKISASRGGLDIVFKPI